MEADPYDADLYKWFGKPFAHEYCNEVLHKGLTHNQDIFEIISCAQFLAMESKIKAHMPAKKHISAESSAEIDSCRLGAFFDLLFQIDKRNNPGLYEHNQGPHFSSCK